VTVSYFEWVQCLNRWHWDEEEVHRRLSTNMTKAFQVVLAESLKRRVSMGLAAHVVAVARVAEAMRARGWL
ncbi:unnamed protein product, partial [marine sediment metagenome]